MLLEGRGAVLDGGVTLSPSTTGLGLSQWPPWKLSALEVAAGCWLGQAQARRAPREGAAWVHCPPASSPI